MGSGTQAALKPHSDGRFILGGYWNGELIIRGIGADGSLPKVMANLAKSTITTGLATSVARTSIVTNLTFTVTDITQTPFDPVSQQFSP